MHPHTLLQSTLNPVPRLGQTPSLGLDHRGPVNDLQGEEVFPSLSTNRHDALCS